MKNIFNELKKQDPEIFKFISQELDRQQHNIELIASENIVSDAVLAATGSILTNKYAEGYPSKRYYGGCEYVDMIENTACIRAKELFHAEYANVQPHSGSQANYAVYFSCLKPNDTIMGMSLSEGGHLTHGSPVNFSGRTYNFIPYGVNSDTQMINYEQIENLALQCKPKMIVAGASAYPRTIDFERFRYIADKVGAYLMVDMAHIAGLVATNQHQSPVPYADFVTSTTHKTLRGPRGGLILCKEKFAKEIDKAIFPGTQGGPLLHIIAAKAVCFKEALTPSFKKYIQDVVSNCSALADALITKNIKLVSGGTDNHLLLIDLSDEDVTGKELETRLDSVHITVNKNTVPNEKRSPFITSGVRIGTAAVTSRGFGKDEMICISDLIHKTIKNFDLNKQYIIQEVKKMCDAHPIYKGMYDETTS